LVTENKNALREDIIKYFKKSDVADIYIPKKIVFVDEMFILGAGKVDFVEAKNYVLENL
jgi:acyl-[acyl-carrier-protein]-phospholipid O-acyltransferase/long-chain-fatty-acid--[acyl-carrier-protein] ligase